MTDTPYQPPFKDEVGKVYGRLTVVERVYPKRNLLMRCRAIFKVKCSCGVEFSASGTRLRRGDFRECAACNLAWGDGK